MSLLLLFPLLSPILSLSCVSRLVVMVSVLLLSQGTVVLSLSLSHLPLALTVHSAHPLHPFPVSNCLHSLFILSLSRYVSLRWWSDLIKTNVMMLSMKLCEAVCCA